MTAPLAPAALEILAPEAAVLTTPHESTVAAAQPQNSFYALIPHCVESSFLALPGDRGWTLPHFHPAERYTAAVGGLNSHLHELLGIEVSVLRCAYLELVGADTGPKSATALFVMENHSPTWTPPEGARWVGREELACLALVEEWQRAVLAEWFREEATEQYPVQRPAWSYKGWVSCITDWVYTELAAMGIRLEGSLEQVKHWDISSIWKANTSSGAFYFKATPTMFAHEPRMTAGLARLFPLQIPAPIALATYPDQGWMLLRDFGGKVTWQLTIEQKEAVLHLLARMQIEAISHTATLYAAGCVDRRLEKLSTQVAEMCRDSVAMAKLTVEEREKLRGLVPTIDEICSLLASGPVPQTLLHGDFHGGNIASTEDGYLIFDWTDGCISHPFFDLLTFIEPERDDYLQLRDAYLQEWTSYAPLETLRDIFEQAFSLGSLHHALSYRTIFANSEEPMRVELQGAPEYFLRRFLAGH